MIIKIERKNNQTLLIWCPINKSKQKFQTLLMSRDSITRSNRWPTSFVSLKRTKRKTNLLIAKLERPSQWKTWSLSCWFICLFFLFKQATRPFSIWDCTFSKEWYDLFFFLYFSCFFLNSFRVLDAQVAFHQGRTAEAGRLLHQAQEELTRLVVRDDQLSQLVSLGEPFWNTFLWNSTKGQLSGTPFVKWNWKDPFLEQVLWNQTKRVSFWNTFRQMKRERSRSGTSFVKPNKNVPFLEHFIKWNQYDLFSGTRFLKGNKYDPFLEHVSSNRTKKVTFWNMFHK